MIKFSDTSNEKDPGYKFEDSQSQEPVSDNDNWDYEAICKGLKIILVSKYGKVNHINCLL